MAAQEELVRFVREALAHDVPRPDIERVLVKAGWRESITRNALRGYADVTFPVPVPRPRPSLDARDAFMYLLMFATLYISAFNLGSLAFQFIDRALVDPAASAASRQWSDVAIRWALSALIVSSPVFLIVAGRVASEVRREPARQDSPVRRGLTYLTLFLGAGVLIGDLIGLVYGVLGGELTTRFLLKTLVVGVLAAGVMAFSRSLTVTVKEADLS